MNKEKLYVVGVGPGNTQLITQRAISYIDKSDVLIAGQRHLDTYLKEGQEGVVINSKLDDIISYIYQHYQQKLICVLASGDPGLFSISHYLKKNLKGVKIEVVPGISAYQYFCSKLNIAWHDIHIFSVHGRGIDGLFKKVASEESVIVFTGVNCPPNQVAKYLYERGYQDLELIVGENLSYDDERIVTGTTQDIMHDTFQPLSMLLIKNPSLKEGLNKVAYLPIGIEEHHFLRAKVPMTKSEVRAITLSKLQLKDELTIYDIGAGTGSISIECALASKGSNVIAIERKENAVALIKENKKHFNLTNIRVVHGLAPCYDLDLPKPDRVFIGGSAGNMAEIFKWLVAMDHPFKLVINAITIETVSEATHALYAHGFKNIDIAHVSIAKGRRVGHKHLMEGQNPIYIMSGDFGGLE